MLRTFPMKNRNKKYTYICNNNLSVQYADMTNEQHIRPTGKFKKLLIIILTVCISHSAFASGSNMIFESISIEKGLSSRTVYCITQDASGYLWFGTDDGLNRYDGYSFKVFKQDPNESSSISNSFINCCLRTRDNTLWFGTNKGLNSYNPVNETFSTPQPENDLHKELATQRIRVIYEDKSGHLWIGTQNGLFKYDRKANKMEVFLFQQQRKNIYLNIIRSIYEDEDGMLWVGTFDGLFRLNPQTKAYKHYIVKKHPSSDEMPNNLVMYIYSFDEDDQYLWLGTETGLCQFNKNDGSFEIFNSDDNKTGITNSAIKNIVQLGRDQLLLGTDGGLNLFNVVTKKATGFLHNKQNNLSICDNIIWSIYKDASGIIWFGTSNGISKSNTRRKKFNINTLADFQHEIIVNSLATDDKKQVWLATYNGVFCINPANNKTSQYLLDTNSGSSKYSKKIFIDKKGNIWGGTNNGLFYWDRKSNGLKKVIIKESPLLLKYIFGITEDENGNIWTNVNNGLCRITPTFNAAGQLSDFSYEVVSIIDQVSHNQNNEISCLHGDNNQKIWFGITNEGLFNYDIRHRKINRFRFDPRDKNSINSNSIINIFSDHRGKVYVITDRGLCLYNAQKNNFTQVDLDNFYRNSLHNGIVDQQDNIWLSSFQNLLYYDVKKQKTISFDFSHELRNKGFVSNSIFRNKDGMIFVGSYDRYVSFYPQEIVSSIADSVVKPAMITAIKVFDNDIKWIKVPEEDRNEQVEEVVLEYNQNFIRIHFSLLEFSAPTSNKYSYMLEGVDKNWNTTSGMQNFASYSNLEPGDYTFYLRGTNPDGFTSMEVTKMNIIIYPPWWKSWWAYVIYALLILVLLFYILRIVRSRILLAQQLKQEKTEREKNEEINTIKLRFFTNISHEFRTPLTLILGPIETLMEQIHEPKFQEQFSIMKSNAERLLRLINQIMDFRKIENKKMELNTSSMDIVSFVKSIYNMFNDHAIKRNIEFVFDSSCSQCIMSFDNDKIEKVMFNLLSNAFKFTADQGCITVSLDRKTNKEGDELIEIAVSDNGVGVTDSEKELIFERFHQSKKKSIEGVEGTGIGLTLCKEFVELHNGKIYVKSNNGQGSVFVVLLPIIDEQINTVEDESIADEELVGQIETEKKKVLIVEDNAEMRNYLRMSLEDTYEVSEATDGTEGMNAIQQSMPDIIVSDLMMPNMNGLEFCNKIKSNMVTSHIPFIILTAKVNEETTYEGFSYGADDYITKPFSMRLLQIRIAKLIEKNQKLQEHFRLGMLSEPQNLVVESSNEKFIYLLVKIIDENIDNFDLNIELLCQKMNITHQQIYRKLKALTGQTVNEFIRSVRLKRAAQLLSDSDMNISEIMYSVGFSNRSYFSKCFAEEYELTPKEYRAKNSVK